MNDFTINEFTYQYHAPTGNFNRHSDTVTMVVYSDGCEGNGCIGDSDNYE